MKRTLDDVDYFSDSDEEVDRALVENLDRVEQLGGALGSLFRFQLQRIGQRRRWRQITDHMQFHATLHQLRASNPRDNIGLSLMEAMHEAIRTQIATLDNVLDHDRLHFAIQAHGFVHGFRSVNIEVGEFLRRSAYLNELLDTLAGKLNSNEQFDPQRGFQLEVVVVRMPRPGRGNGKRLNVGRRSMARDNALKRCLIPINNKDELCCARAIGAPACLVPPKRSWGHGSQQLECSQTRSTKTNRPGQRTPSNRGRPGRSLWFGTVGGLSKSVVSPISVESHVPQ